MSAEAHDTDAYFFHFHHVLEFLCKTSYVEAAQHVFTDLPTAVESEPVCHVAYRRQRQRQGVVDRMKSMLCTCWRFQEKSIQRERAAVCWWRDRQAHLVAADAGAFVVDE